MSQEEQDSGLRIVFFVAIVLLAAFLRFWNFQHRLILFSDSARDALVGLGAVRTHEIPLTGSFSSAGPFVFGPVFYYLIMASQALLLGIPFAPWYVVAGLSVAFVVVVVAAVTRFAGPRAGLIALIFSAVSPAQVMRATALTQHSVVGIASACFLLFMICFREKRTLWWAFLLGLSSGIAASLHYQALVLLVAGMIVVCFWRSKIGLIVRDLVWYIIGTAIPFLPLIVWDSWQQWANVRNLLDYLLIGQYRIFVSRRWLTFILEFLPTTWGQVIGGGSIIGLFLVSLVVVATIVAIARREWIAPVRWASLAFGLLLVTARYYRGELFEGYLVAFHPFILFLSAWAIWKVWKIQRVIGLIMLFVIVAGSVRALIPIVTWNQNLVAPAEGVVDLVQESKIAPVIPFDFQYYSSEFTYALSYLLETKGLISSSGTPVGVCLWQCPEYLTKQSITHVPYMDRSYHVIAVNSEATNLRDRKLWTDVSASGTLDEVGFWWRRTPLISNFSLADFIRNDVLK